LTFSDFNFDEKLLDGLLSMGYSKPTPIQQQAIPIILQNKDLIACAQTGTGKTAAYILPVLNKIVTSGSHHLNTLVIAPTRELAQQIDQQIEGFAYFLGVSSIPVYVAAMEPPGISKERQWNLVPTLSLLHQAGL